MDYFSLTVIFIINDLFAEPFAAAPVIEDDKSSYALIRSGACENTRHAES
jgi:hypothetical protein